MSDEGFFEDVFDRPEDDPLLGEEEPVAPDEQDVQPSWTREESEASEAYTSSPAGSRNADHADGPEQKTVVVRQEASNTDGLDALNKAVQRGWRIDDLDLKSGRDEATTDRIVVTLERNGPQSLFEFGDA